MVGFGLVAFSLVLFVYYTLWILVLVGVSSGRHNPSQFPLGCFPGLGLGAGVSVCLGSFLVKNLRAELPLVLPPHPFWVCLPSRGQDPALPVPSTLLLSDRLTRPVRAGAR